MKLVCDFCFDENPCWEYRVSAEAQLVGQYYDGTKFEDGGEWLACEACSAAIEKRDHDTLVLRGHRNPPFKWNERSDREKIEIDLKLIFLAEFLLDNFKEPRKPWKR